MTKNGLEKDIPLDSKVEVARNLFEIFIKDMAGGNTLKIAKVVVDVAASPIDSALDYEIPEHFQDIVQAGIRVIVPLGPRKVMGFVVGLTNHSEFDQLKPIQEVMDYTPILTKELITYLLG